MGEVKADNKKVASGVVGEKKPGSAKKNQTSMKEELSRLKIWQLVLALFLVVGGTVLFIGVVSGWFGGGKVTLDVEYYCQSECDDYMVELSGEEYEDLVSSRKSFVVFVDQGGCKTADNLRGFVLDYAKEKGLKVYRLFFGDMKETSMHDKVKYYPSVVMVSKGRIVGFLRADSDEDAGVYNEYEAFLKWIERYL